MISFRLSRRQFLCAVQFLMLLQTNVLCYQYQVGDLHAWGTPSSANPSIYTTWSQTHQLNIGDSLLFLYPPSQDSVIQVTPQAFDACDLKNPIISVDDGNFLFNITSPGRFYFTSGIPGRCKNSQKLQISVLLANGSALPPSYGYSPADSPSYPTVFGSIPTTPTPSPMPMPMPTPTTSSSLPLRSLSSTIFAVVFGATIFMIISSRIQWGLFLDTN